MIGFRVMFAGMPHNQVPGADVPGAINPEIGTKSILKIRSTVNLEGKFKMSEVRRRKSEVFLKP
jgi:hypothetical protein